MIVDGIKNIDLENRRKLEWEFFDTPISVNNLVKIQIHDFSPVYSEDLVFNLYGNITLDYQAQYSSSYENTLSQIITLR